MAGTVAGAARRSTVEVRRKHALTTAGGPPSPTPSTCTSGTRDHHHQRACLLLVPQAPLQGLNSCGGGGCGCGCARGRNNGQRASQFQIDLPPPTSALGHRIFFARGLCPARQRLRHHSRRRFCSGLSTVMGRGGWGLCGYTCAGAYVVRRGRAR